ncbi:MAG: hypothetical protein HY898_30255 [Deltaproteobacteria bacterium]|nr:hypothetical protein [Deltaproteobacteria bacterium]
MNRLLGPWFVVALVLGAAACGSDDELAGPYGHGGSGGSVDGSPGDSAATDSKPDTTSKGGSGGAVGDGSAGFAGGVGGSAGGVAGAGGAAGTSSGGSAGADSGPNLHICAPVGPPECDPPADTTPVECNDFDPCYLKVVQAGIQAALTNHPELFDTNPPDASPGCTLVLDVAGYVAAVGEHVIASGLCFDPGAPAYEEVGVKHDNGFAETFDILTAEMCVRSGNGIYRGWCSPPWF